MNGVHGGLIAIDKERNHKDGAQWHMGFLDKITNASESMSNTCETVMNELNDSPLYLEVNEDSIVNYKNRYSKQPFMPLSSTTLALKPPWRHEPEKVTTKATKDNYTFDGTNIYTWRDPSLGYPGTS